MPRVVVYPYWCQDCKNVFAIRRNAVGGNKKCPNCQSPSVQQIKDFQP